MTRTAERTARPELVGDEDCSCDGRCSLDGPCLEVLLTDERFGILARAERPALRLAS